MLSGQKWNYIMENSNDSNEVVDNNTNEIAINSNNSEKNADETMD
ncbi:18769_t:CDS:2 [Racocetra fulgida]|uniref:18769_t:CDS:1 n=1 Tax=Racocetra fulgida TaxID=60492 RepID=A0A9N8WG95_9GLOM|nr:18769_t:CDS:2 [Racocetra fulgida]